ncbi:MAG TPA: IS66 family insertion sequence element accessory protein TnpB [Xanthobacteraceae bacterium]|jgi:transposase|nr:IS66 family insertion sequence element accessory protein TnpB [Xanthobacteraceae bacterium]
MIGPAGAVRVMLATRPVDFRKGMDGLALLVRESMGADPFSGTVYAFRSKRADRLKLLFFDGTGVVLVAKRLEVGAFRWPKPGDAVVRLSAVELAALVEGLDWRRVHEPREVVVPMVAG